MKFKQFITIPILLGFFNYSSLMAQNKENTSIEKKEYLKGLTELTKIESFIRTNNSIEPLNWLPYLVKRLLP